MGKSAYAVVVGRRPGVYTSWEQCLAQVKGFPANRYKGFNSNQEALQYLADNGVAVAGSIAPAGQLAAQSHAAPPAAAARGTAAAAEAAGAASVAAAAPPPRKRGRPPGSKKQPATAAAAAGAAGEAAAPPPPKRGRPPSSKKQPAAAPAAARAAAAGGPLTGRVFRLEFDGASKNNPGPAGLGAVLYDDATGVEVARMCQYLGGYHTNNQAEYAGLIAGLEAALDLGCRNIKVKGDSTLIIRQVLGEWQVKNEGLRPYHAAACQLARHFDSFQAQQVPRAQNKVADELSNQAISDYRSGVNRQLWSLEAVAARAAGEWRLPGGEDGDSDDGGGPSMSDLAAAAGAEGEEAEPAKRARHD